ncbi:TlpA family protein disulfide reductase [Rheinheimera sp. WS51]|uniref:TlpA family protein disulfide reductase n=1 Tax=Rheinheimera sp. WS51 TaxID=3425886 RepID=UPI003D8AA8B9
MIAVNLGPLALPVSPLLTLISIIIGFTVTSFVAKKAGVQQKESASNALFIILLTGLVVGRFVFVLRFADSYDSFWQMLDIRDRGIDYMAALFSALVVLFIQLKQRQLRKALLSGVITMIALFTLFTLVITAGQAQAVLPDTSFMQLDGKKVKISDISQQRPTVVNLWASWCPPCRREMPVLQQAEQRYADISFILLNQREPTDTVEHFLQQNGLSFKHVLLDNKGDMATAMAAFGLPVTLYFDTNGRLVHSHMGELSAASLQQSIEQYLK